MAISGYVNSLFALGWLFFIEMFALYHIRRLVFMGFQLQFGIDHNVLSWMMVLVQFNTGHLTN